MSILCHDYVYTRMLVIDAKQKTHFFDPQTMRFFKSHLSQVAYIVHDKNGTKFAYFVSSEKGPSASDARLYTARVLIMHPGKKWTTNCIGEFQAHSSMKSAANAMRAACEKHYDESGEHDEKAFYTAHYILRDKNRAEQND